MLIEQHHFENLYYYQHISAASLPVPTPKEEITFSALSKLNEEVSFFSAC